MQNNIEKAFEKMQNKYQLLSKGRKFQVLSMIIVNGELKDDIYYNKFNNHNFSIVNEHCERQAFENFSNAEDIIIIVTIAPCDQCFKNFIEKNKNIKKIIYLCEEFLENKKHIYEDGRIEPASKYINVNQYDKLLIGYKKYKHKEKVKKQNKIIVLGVEENVNQPTYF